MAWRCGSHTARFSQHGRVVVEKGLREELSRAPASLLDLCAGPFFRFTLLAYALGLILTLYVMFTFDAAQPALLYLVPACLGASALVGVCRGEFAQLAAYTEEDEAPPPPGTNGAAAPKRAASPRRGSKSPKRAASPKRAGATTPWRRSARIASQ